MILTCGIKPSDMTMVQIRGSQWSQVICFSSHQNWVSRSIQLITTCVKDVCVNSISLHLLSLLLQIPLTFFFLHALSTLLNWNLFFHYTHSLISLLLLSLLIASCQHIQSAVDNTLFSHCFIFWTSPNWNNFFDN